MVMGRNKPAPLWRALSTPLAAGRNHRQRYSASSMAGVISDNILTITLYFILQPGQSAGNFGVHETGEPFHCGQPLQVAVTSLAMGTPSASGA